MFSSNPHNIQVLTISKCSAFSLSSRAQAAWISAIVGAVCAVLSGIFGIPYLRWKLRNKINAREGADAAAIEAANSDPNAKARLEMIVSDPLTSQCYRRFYPRTAVDCMCGLLGPHERMRTLTHEDPTREVWQ